MFVQQDFKSLYLLNILSGVTCERCPPTWLYTRAHNSSLQWCPVAAMYVRVDHLRTWTFTSHFRTRYRITWTVWLVCQDFKSNLLYTRLLPFRMSQVSGAHLRSFAPGPTHQGCSGGKSLALGGRFYQCKRWTPYFPHQRQTSYHLRHLAGYVRTSIAYSKYFFNNVG